MFRYQYDEGRNNIVTLSFSFGSSDHEADHFFEFFDSLLDKKSPFFLILETDGASGFNPEKKKQLSLWFKREKRRLERYCLGMARIVPHMSLAEKFSAMAYKKLMPFPYLVTLDKLKALEWIEKISNDKKFQTT
jgi:hypothetical protein